MTLKPCNENVIELANRMGLITINMKEELKSKYPSIPLLCSQAFNTYRENNLKNELMKCDPRMRRDYEKSVRKLWSLDTISDSLLIKSISEEDEETLVNILEEQGVEVIYAKAGLEQEKYINRINKLKLLEKKLSKAQDDKVISEINHECSALKNSLGELNYKINSLSLYGETLESYLLDLEKREIQVYVLSSGLSPYSWERLDAGSCLCDNEDGVVLRDYKTSHNETSVLNNLISRPASFYLFTELAGIERGYSRGEVLYDEDSIYLKVEALHAKGCNNCSNRTYDDESISEVSLLGGLFRLAKVTGVKEIRWGNCGVSNNYGLMEKKKSGRIKYFPVKI